MTIKIVDWKKWLKHPSSPHYQTARDSWLTRQGYAWEHVFSDKADALIHAKALDRTGKNVIIVKHGRGHGEESWIVWAK